MIKNLTAKLLHEPDADYRARRALTRSGLLDFEESPLYYKRKHLDRTIREPDSPAMSFGRYFHTLMLEPEQLEHRFAFRPEGLDMRTKEGREFKEANKGKDFITPQERDTALDMRDSIHEIDLAREMLTKGKAEITVLAESPDFPLAVQARLDYLVEGPYGPEAILDIKTCDDLARFEWDLRKFQYDRQDGFYTPLVRAATTLNLPFYFLAVEKSGGHRAGLFLVGEAERGAAEDKNAASIERLAECIKTDVWPRGNYEAARTVEWLNPSATDGGFRGYAA